MNLLSVAVVNNFSISIRFGFGCEALGSKKSRYLNHVTNIILEKRIIIQVKGTNVIPRNELDTISNSDDLRTVMISKLLKSIRKKFI